MINQDRQPKDKQSVADAVSTWLQSEPFDGEASADLLDVLVKNGVMTQEEANDAEIDEYQDEYQDEPSLFVYVGDNATLVIVDEYGNVTVE